LIIEDLKIDCSRKSGREEDREATEVNTHETCGLDTELNILKYLTIVHKYAPTKRMGEKKKKSRSFFSDIDIREFFYKNYIHIFSFRVDFFPISLKLYYRIGILAVFVPQLKLYNRIGR